LSNLLTKENLATFHNRYEWL